MSLAAEGRLAEAPDPQTEVRDLTIVEPDGARSLYEPAIRVRLYQIHPVGRTPRSAADAPVGLLGWMKHASPMDSFLAALFDLTAKIRP